MFEGKNPYLRSKAAYILLELCWIVRKGKKNTQTKTNRWFGKDSKLARLKCLLCSQIKRNTACYRNASKWKILTVCKRDYSVFVSLFASKKERRKDHQSNTHTHKTDGKKKKTNSTFRHFELQCIDCWLGRRRRARSLVRWPTERRRQQQNIDAPTTPTKAIAFEETFFSNNKLNLNWKKMIN